MRIHRTRALIAPAAAAALALLNFARAAATAAAGAAAPGGRQVPPATIYVVDAVGTVTPVNAATNTAGPPITVGRRPGAIAITPNGGTAYVANSRSATVTPIDTATNTAGPPITVGSNPGYIAITPNGKTAYVANSGSGTVTPVTTATNTAGPTIKVGGSPTQLAITPNGKTVYVPNGNALVVPVNTATNKAGRHINLGGINTNLIVITPNGKTAFVLWATKPHLPVLISFGRVTAIRTATNTLGNSNGCDIQSCRDGALVITPDGKTAYVLCTFPGFLFPLNTGTGARGKDISVGNQPVAMAITP